MCQFMHDGRNLVFQLDLPFLTRSSGLQILVVELNLTNVWSERSLIFAARSCPSKISFVNVIFHGDINDQIMSAFMGSLVEIFDFVALP